MAREYTPPEEQERRLEVIFSFADGKLIKHCETEFMANFATESTYVMHFKTLVYLALSVRELYVPGRAHAGCPRRRVGTPSSWGGSGRDEGCPQLQIASCHLGVLEMITALLLLRSSE